MIGTAISIVGRVKMRLVLVVVPRIIITTVVARWIIVGSTAVQAERQLGHDQRSPNLPLGGTAAAGTCSSVGSVVASKGATSSLMRPTLSTVTVPTPRRIIVVVPIMHALVLGGL